MADMPERSELVSESRDFVFRDAGQLAAERSFSVVGATEIEALPPDARMLIRPLFVGKTGSASAEQGSVQLEVKSTMAMGKAAFVEQSVIIDGIEYGFVQWKGVGSNAVNENVSAIVEAMGGTVDYPLGQDGVSPLFFIEVQGKKMLRFNGSAFYVDLLVEAERSRQFAEFGLRMPKILATVKYSREFCLQNDLPLPADDDPSMYGGQTLIEFLEEHREIDPALRKRMAEADELRAGYDSAALGQNIRAFRNVWRVSEIEQVMKVKDEGVRRQQLRSMIDASRQVLSREFGVELSDEEFLRKYAELLGDQGGILTENGLLQGAMNNHKQDITLAAEICDFDGGEFVNDEYIAATLGGSWVGKNIRWMDETDEDKRQWFLDNEKYEGNKRDLRDYWGGKVTKEKLLKKWTEQWKSYIFTKLHRQILLLGAHLKPLADAERTLSGGSSKEKTMIDSYAFRVVDGLSPEKKTLLLKELDNPRFADIQDIAGSDEQTKYNFAGYQTFFDAMVTALKEKLKAEAGKTKP